MRHSSKFQRHSSDSGRWVVLLIVGFCVSFQVVLKPTEPILIPAGLIGGSPVADEARYALPVHREAAVGTFNFRI